MSESDHAIDRMQRLFEAQRQAFAAQPMPDYAARRDSLRRLKVALVKHRHRLSQAVAADFGRRSEFETLFADLMPSVRELNHALRHLRGWMRPRRSPVSWLFQPARAAVHYQPLGVVGIIVPWNYPVFLAIGPLIGALAAGNRALLKLSEFTPATNAVLQGVLAEAFGADEVAVVQGEREVSEAFSRLPFDHLLFTGSTPVGHHVMRAAADNLTPVTLELGGKSPVLVDTDANIATTAASICFGKSINAGQTCIAPDYVLCPRERVEDFCTAYAAAFARMYPDLADNGDYSSIVSERHLQRLRGLVDEAKAGGARVIDLGAGQALPQRKLAPQLVLNITDAMAISREEIFGPLLPVIGYDDLDQAIVYVSARPRPLALYYFGHDRARQARVLAHTHAGGVCINETLTHIMQEELPFGGVGPSGMGRYHGRSGFETFSNAKGVLRRGRLNPLRMFYPPYRKQLMRWAEKLLLR